MGFDIDRFCSTVSVDVLCNLCLGVLDNPLKTKCGHLFCSECVVSWIEKFGTCPLGCMEVLQEDLEEVAELKDNILHLSIHCVNRNFGCSSVQKLSEMGKHLKVCKYRKQCSVEDECENLKNNCNNGKLIKMQCQSSASQNCNKGCGLPVQPHMSKSHDCVMALRSFIAGQENQINIIKFEMKKFVNITRQREKFLLNQVLNLQNELKIRGNSGTVLDNGLQRPTDVLDHVNFKVSLHVFVSLL